VLEQEDAAHRKQRYDQPDHAVNGVAPRDYHDRGRKRHGGEKKKCELGQSDHKEFRSQNERRDISTIIPLKVNLLTSVF
jgi:hypothetical protein